MDNPGRLIYAEQNDTWNKLGYVLHGNSMLYKKVLADNPGWDMTIVPSPGTVLYSSSVRERLGTLSSVPYTDVSELEREITSETFPWETNQDRVNRLTSYSASAISLREEINLGR